jgi:hypothetical protein
MSSGECPYRMFFCPCCRGFLLPRTVNAMGAARRQYPSIFLRKIRNLNKRRLRNIISRFGYSIRPPDDLTVLADRFGTDKGSTAHAHRYTRIYSKIFKRQRRNNITLVEIGIGRPDTPSLRMWRNYFEVGHIFGFDVEDFSTVIVKGCTIIQGDMSVQEDLMRLVSCVGRPIEILIDDGSHASHHQQIALGALFSKLSPGGVYAIEDLHWTNTLLEKSGARKTRDMLRHFSSSGKIESPYISAAERNYLEENIKSITLFDSLSVVHADTADALAILVKKDD